MTTSESNNLVDETINELNILKFWKDNPITRSSLFRRIPYIICSYPNLYKVSLNHSKLHSSVIKDVLLRFAYQNGFNPILYEYGKLSISLNDNDFTQTIERLGCIKEFIQAEVRTIYECDDDVLRVYYQLCKKKLVYQHKQILAYCTFCKGPVSKLEKDLHFNKILAPFALVTFPLKDRPDAYFLVWSVSVWTLTTNLGLCVNPNSIYTEIKELKTQKIYILAQNCFSHIFSGYAETEIDILKSYRGDSLKGIGYTPILDYFIGDKNVNESNFFKVFCNENVDDNEGTGINCMAPHLCQSDYDFFADLGIINEDALDPLYPIDESGRFTVAVEDFQGCHVLDCQKALIVLMKSTGRLKATGFRRLSVPFCLRCGTRLIEKAVDSKFIRLKPLIAELRKYNNAECNWTPNIIGDYSLLDWFGDVQDWPISCSQPGGIPIPPLIDETDDDCLEQEGEDKKNTLLEKISNTLSVPSVSRGSQEKFHYSFESAAFTIAQYSLIEDNSKSLKMIDIIAENIEEASSWFKYLLILSVAINGKPVVRNVLLTDVTLVNEELRMTARMDIDPPIRDVLERFKSDAYRIYCLSSTIVKENRIPLIDVELLLISENILNPLYHACEFLVNSVSQYRCEMQHYVFNDHRLKASTKNLVGAWILSLHGQFIAAVKIKMNAHQLEDVVIQVITFVGELSDWYIHLNREEASLNIFDTIFYILFDLAITLMPITPFLSEHLYQQLSVFLYEKKYSTVVNASNIFSSSISAHLPSVEAAVTQMKTAIELGKSIRYSKQIPKRYALSEIVIIHSSMEYLQRILPLRSYILSELNIETLTTAKDPKEYDLRMKANAILARVYNRSNSERLRKYLHRLSEKDIQQNLLKGNICQNLGVSLEDIKIYYIQKGNTAWKGYDTKTDGDVIVLINTRLQDDVLQTEFIAMEIINYTRELQDVIKWNVHKHLRVFYEVLSYSSDRTTISTIKNAILTHKARIEEQIACEFLPFLQEQRTNWKIIIQDSFVISGANLKIYICKT